MGMKRILFLLVVLLLAFPFITQASPIGAAVAEGDGDPSGWAYKFVFSNGTTTLSSGVATVTVGGGAGDVTGVGDCADGACGDGSSDGGTYYRFYDGDSNYIQLDVGNLAVDYTFNLPLSTDITDEYLCTWEATGTKLVCDTNPATFNAGTATALAANGANCTAGGSQCALGTDASGAAECQDLSAIYQPLDTDLTTWAGVTSSTNGRSLVSAETYAAMKVLTGWLTDIVDDTTPTLGGDLDLNDKIIYDDVDAFADDDLTPSVTAGTYFKTGSLAADQLISDFINGTVGQTIHVMIADVYSDFDFTASGLVGHGGVDLDDPPVGTILTCTYYDDTQWYCDVSQWTSLTLSNLVIPTTANPAQTANGDEKYDTTNDWDTIGDGASRRTYVSVNTKTDEGICTYESATKQIECDMTALDGETISADTIDDDSIDFADVTCADITMTDCAAVAGTTGTFTGTLAGLVGVTLDTDAAVDLATASNAAGAMRVNNDADAIDYTLPPCAAGLNVCFYGIAAGVITVDPDDGTDTIYLNGTSVGAGDAIDSPGAVGDFICLLGLDDTRWATLGRSGTWVDGGVD
jgi:hypothetical protein